MTWLHTFEILGHLSFLLCALSFLVKDMLWLRLLAIVGNAAGILYNAYAPAEPMWLVIAWLSVFIGINGVQIALLVRARKSVRFTEEERELYETLFRGFSPVEFLKLLRVGAWRGYEPSSVLARVGEPLDALILLVSGHAEVEVGDGRAVLLRDGAFVGEMSFLHERPASATVRATTPVRCLVWHKAALRQLLDRNPSLQLGLHAVISSDLVRKVQKQ